MTVLCQPKVSWYQINVVKFNGSVIYHTTSCSELDIDDVCNGFYDLDVRNVTFEKLTDN